MAQAGDTAVYRVEAIGNGLTYQWYYITPAGNTYASSNQTAQYGFTVSADRHGRKVYCVVTDSAGNSVTTNRAGVSIETDTFGNLEDRVTAIEKWPTSPATTVYGPSRLVSFDAGAGGLPIRSCRVTGVAEPVTVYRTGKNLFDKANVEKCFVESDGTVTQNNAARSSGYIPINGAVTVSCLRIGTGTDNRVRVATYDANKGFLSRVLSSTTTAGNYSTATINDSTVCYIRVSIFPSTQDIDTLQVELGTGRTAFEAFGDAWIYDPATDSLTPPIMTSLADINNIWSDGGAVTVEYGAFLQAIQEEIESLEKLNDMLAVTAADNGKILGVKDGRLQLLSLDELPLG